MKIVQDLLPNDYKAQLQEVLFGAHFPFYWQDTASKKAEGGNIFQLTHVFFRDGAVNSDYFKLIEPMFGYIKESTGIGSKNIFRVKTNLLPRQICNDHDITKEIHLDVDRDREDLTSLIYYLHDVDGDITTYDKDYNVVNSYSPKENSLVYFNSNTLHGTRPPIRSKRRVCINFILGAHD
jgi:hypothetical protein